MTENENITERLRLIIKNSRRNLLFCGPVGVGKTYNALIALRLFYGEKNAEKIKYQINDTKIKQLIKNNSLIMRKIWDENISKQMYPMEMMLRADILLIDDIWVGDCTVAYIRDMTFIINERLEKNRITIYTTNLNNAEIRALLGDRLASRILYNCDVIVMNWPDRRAGTTLIHNL